MYYSDLDENGKIMAVENLAGIYRDSTPGLTMEESRTLAMEQYASKDEPPKDYVLDTEGDIFPMDKLYTLMDIAKGDFPDDVKEDAIDNAVDILETTGSMGYEPPRGEMDTWEQWLCEVDWQCEYNAIVFTADGDAVMI